ncbi:hypothetical protein SAMN05661080_01915 [Modestobacter sp. DSM 44400]|uniref:hypothetical protein n=1 Tax=Modestobacter sp. DSM 44400 TaxID=1550230 RepID=UPI0008960361|nr:hypothetical protein [Modestobacter sp. DSM 44400]SDX98203.1 hypothetical protein SAMN05661080_01915 [Modestobacter sp. DSM 44400]
MTRRPVLPGAAELFRRTDVPATQSTPVTELSTLAAAQASPALRSAATAAESAAGMPLSLVPARALDDLSTLRSALPAPAHRPAPGPSDSGRARHAEKITVYCSAEELLALESARLTLRGQHRVVADRGRIVREAIAVLLADLDEHGEDSVLVRRLRRG